MFFDPGFVPANYLDQLFFQLVGDTLNRQTYAKLADTKALSAVNNLITELDFHTQELVDQLLLDKLQQALVLLNDKTTRLQYYDNVVANAVAALELELAGVKADLEQIELGEPNEVVDTLTDLGTAKTNLQAVLAIYEDVYRAVGQTAVTPTQLSQLFEAHKDDPQFRAKFDGLLDGLIQFKRCM